VISPSTTVQGGITASAPVSRVDLGGKIMPTLARAVELWCDSFHEGDWAAEGIIKRLPHRGVSRTHRHGFIPCYSIDLPKGRLELQVYGGYGNWVALPNTIRSLLDWGKPDIIGYDRTRDEILFAVEETAAVPTGNQSLQRCERMHGAGLMKVPFWYLLSQFGTHVDEGTRQASFWPALMAVALTATFRRPNIVLFYSSESEPENYSAGAGMTQLFDALARILQNYCAEQPSFTGMDDLLSEHYTSMLKFIGDTYKNVSDYLPSADLLAQKTTAQTLAAIASGSDDGLKSFPLLEWPPVAELPEDIRGQQTAGTFIKQDRLLAEVEEFRTRKTAYTLSANAGSRPQPESDLRDWISEQNALHLRAEPLKPPVSFDLDLRDFPASPSGRRHVTTAKNILYLIDSTHELFAVLSKVFPRLRSKLPTGPDKPAILYVSNSVKPGRIFGDPYTGQFAAFSWIFGGTEANARTRIAYFPHHSHGVLQPGRRTRNKGQLLFLRRADYLIFHAGAAYSTRDSKWL
jgi:hypothetical protein